MKRGAITAVTTLVAAAAIFAPQASAAETLINFVGPKKLKVQKSIGYEFVCSVACNVAVADVLIGPGLRDPHSVTGSLEAGAKGGFGGKPNGPLLKELRDNPGRYKLAVTLTATDALTGEIDVDKRTYKFK